MDERRKAQRGRTLKAGTIAFNRAAGISCRVRNVSPAGACLEVASQIGIPDEFMLVIDYDKFKQACHVIWRSDTRIGVAFRAAKGAEAA
ncbi:MAG TPA: PilZ domain-containing protein [Pseudolabrys sp.]|nr:PilZ domain-containing protein [Pseudolabrys sp.]